MFYSINGKKWIEHHQKITPSELIELLAKDYEELDSDSGWWMSIEVLCDGVFHTALVEYDSGYLGGYISSILIGTKEELKREYPYAKWNKYDPQRDYILVK